MAVETGACITSHVLEEKRRIMSAANVSRIGQVNSAGDEKAIFLKVFAGEVLVAFSETTQFMPRSMVRNITSGQSAQFPASGKSSASYHTPGTELLGQALNHAERVVSIDDMLISDHFLSTIDEAMNHYEVRKIYSKQMGEALAVTADQNIAQVFALAAKQTTGTVTGISGGSEISSANMNTSGSEILIGAYGAAEALDEKDVPQGGFPNGPSSDRNMFLAPTNYYDLVQNTAGIDRDFGGEGSIAAGTIFRVAGFNIVKTNNLPTTVISTGPAAYQGDFSDLVAVCAHASAVGTVKLLDLRTEMGYDIRRQGTLLVAKYAVGHGILRPEAAVNLLDS